MKITVVTAVELILFNLAFFLIYQPQFIFNAFKLSKEKEKTIRTVMTSFGVVTICLLFIWSFIVGAILFLYKQALIYN